MGGIVNGITMILAKLAAVVQWIGKLFVAVFVSLWDMARDVFCWGFEGLCKIVQAAITALPAFTVPDLAQYLTFLPPETRNMLGVIGLDDALAIILGAILVKLALQVIPFTRLGG